MNRFPFLTGLSAFLSLFAISFVLVFGVKALLLFLGLIPKKKELPPPKKPVKRAPAGKTIVISPDDVSRIYVKRDVSA